MSLITIAIVNGVLAASVVGVLAYICRIPYRLDRVGRAKLVFGSRERKQPEAAYQPSSA